MGTTPLREFLQSLCCNSCWNYAVFWKLHAPSQMLLTWEDEYSSILKQRQSMENILDKICFKGSGKMFSPTCESSICDENLGVYPIEQAMAFMSSVQYALGDGMVGEVAYTGKYLWAFSENILAGENNSELVHECPDEWLLQFAAGIKTLLLVPIVPYGVLQLGSLETVTEDLTLVAYIKDKFIAHLNVVGSLVPCTGHTEFMPRSSSSSSIMPTTLMENFNHMSALKMNKMKDEDLSPAQHRLSTTHQFTPPCMIQNSMYISGKDLMTVPSVELTGLTEAPEPLNQSLNCSKFLFTESRAFSISRLDEELLPMIEQPLVEKDTNNTSDSGGAFFSFPRNCELHKALGPSLMGHTNNFFNTADVYAHSSSSLICNGESQSERSTMGEEDKFPLSCVTSAVVDPGRNGNSYSSPSGSLFESGSVLIEEEQKKKLYGYLRPKKGSKLSSVSKRRARPSDNQRPRPRDRQLIQDRVKELRELVPNGAKCTIDGLLDRTVKHMLFLKNVTDQADKLRQLGHHEVAGRKNLKSSETTGGSQYGTSWAFELGSEQTSPIVVKDLEYPGHMLIEMLCNDHGHFIDMAEVMQGLDLIILKGVMESHSDSTWARFIIEAPREFHRLDIFWPLMQLLQQSKIPSQ